MEDERRVDPNDRRVFLTARDVDDGGVACVELVRWIRAGIDSRSEDICC